MKFLISRGPNWEDARVKATRVTENTVPATPIIAPDIVVKILRAESGLLTNKKRIQPSCEMERELSKDTRVIDNTTAKQIMSTGKNQKVAISSFKKKISFFILEHQCDTLIDIVV